MKYVTKQAISVQPELQVSGRDLKRFLLIFSERIFDSSVDRAIPSWTAAPLGPETRPPVSFRAASIIFFSCAFSPRCERDVFSARNTIRGCSRLPTSPVSACRRTLKTQHSTSADVPLANSPHLLRSTQWPRTFSTARNPLALHGQLWIQTSCDHPRLSDNLDVIVKSPALNRSKDNPSF